MPVTYQEIQDAKQAIAEVWATAAPKLGSEVPEDVEFVEKVIAQVDQMRDDLKPKEEEYAAAQQQVQAELKRKDAIVDIQRFLGTQPAQTADRLTNPDAAISYSSAFAELLTHGPASLSARSPESLELLNEHAVEMASLTDRHPQLFALTSSGQDGRLGYLIPDAELQGLVEAKAFETSGILAAGAEQIITEDDKNLPWATEDDTDNGGHWIGEGKSHAGGTDFEVKPMVLGAAACSSRIVKVTHQFRRSMGPERFRAYVMSRKARRLDRTIGEALVNGDGVGGKPLGITRNIHVGHTTTATNTVSWKDLVMLEGNLNVAHRVGAKYVVSPSVETALRLETDDHNRPVWQPSTIVGAPDQFSGRPYHLDPWLDAIAADSMPVLYGHFSAYKYRRVRETLQIVFDKQYLDDLKYGYLMVVFVGGGLVDAGDHPVIALKTAAS